MKRLIIVALVFIMALLFSTTAIAQEACSETEQDFSIPDSFPLNGGDWIVTYGAEVAEPDPEADFDDDGFRMHTNVDGGGDHVVRFRIHFDSPVTISDITADLTAEEAGAAIAYGFCMLEECDLDDFTAVSSGTQDAPYTYEYSTEQTGVYELIIAMGCSGTGSDCELDNLVLHGLIDACLYRPVHAEDVAGEDSAGSVYVISTVAGARVYAIDNGVIETVIHDTDGYAVRLLVNGVDSILYTGLGSVFAQVGDVVLGGCVLGHATEQGPGSVVGESTFNYTHDPDLGDWHGYAESMSNLPCNQPDSNCVNPNPEFDENAVGWSSRYAIADSLNTGDDSVMLVPKNGEIYQSGFPVETDETWYITLVVGLKAPATAGSVTVVFAGTTTTLPFSTFGGEYVTLSTLGLSPAADGTTEFRIDNNFAGSTTLKVTFACLHAGDAVIAPPRCYFEDDGLLTDNFETESGATHGDGLFGTGQYVIPASGVIRAPVSLAAFTDADTDFTLKIMGSAEGAGELTASIVDSDTDDELAAIGVYDYPALFPTNPENTFTVGDGETLIGDLFIENTGSETVIVEAVCLTSDAGVWPGFDNADYGTHELLPVNCQECAFPESLVDVVAWLNWLGCLFRYLIFCLLYTLVNNIWATILAIMSGIGLFGRWLGRSIAVVAVWLWQAVGRLLASLLGSAIPIINAILAWILSLPFVRDVLDAASIAGLWIDGVIQFIVGVINLFVAAVRFVGVLVTLVGTVWAAFIDGLSGSSAITVILPDCYDSGSPFYDVCLLLDVLNFVVSQVIAIAVLFGAVAVSIVWAAARDIKDDIERVFES